MSRGTFSDVEYLLQALGQRDSERFSDVCLGTYAVCTVLPLLEGEWGGGRKRGAEDDGWPVKVGRSSSQSTTTYLDTSKD